MKRIFFLIVIFMTALARGETLELDDGRKLEGELLDQSNSWYMIRIGESQIQIPKSRVRAISSEKSGLNVPDGAIEILPPNTTAAIIVSGEAAPIPESARRAPVTQLPAPETQLPLPDDPTELARLQQAVDSLRIEASLETRALAEQTLTAAGDSGLAVIISYGLYHPLPSVRTASAQLLGSVGGPRVLKYLIETFYAGAVAPLPPYQLAFEKTLSLWISRATGQDFTLWVWRANGAPELADEMAAWWDRHRLELPRQLGEPALDPRGPEFKNQLTKLRTLDLQKREFANSLLPEELLVTFPLTPQESSNYLIFPEQYNGLLGPTPESRIP